MKYKTFRNIALVVAGSAAAVGVYYGTRGDGEEPTNTVETKWTEPAQPEAPEPAPRRELEPPTTTASMRGVAGEVLEAVRRPLAVQKHKDALSGKPYKLNIYQDSGNSTPNRAKLDLDRDGKWDEKWTLDGDSVKRQVSPADDENYSVEYRLKNGAWVSKDEATEDKPALVPEPSAAEPSAGAERQRLRAVDGQIIAASVLSISGKTKDAFAGEAYKVNIYQDDGESLPNRAKVDLDRDGKWDEKWTFEGPGKIKRKVSPNDDEDYSLEYRLREGAWVQKH